MDNRKKEFLEKRRSNKRGKDITPFKTLEDKKRTREEVEQIRKDLINFAESSWGKQWIVSKNS